MDFRSRAWGRRTASGLIVLCMVATAVQATPKVGRPAPDFTVVTDDGRTVRLADLRGDVIVLNIWASWCVHCRLELPLLEAESNAHENDGFRVLPIATEPSVTEAQWRLMVGSPKAPFVRLVKGPYRKLGAIPTNYIIDRSGKLVYAQAGSLDQTSLSAILTPLLSAPVPPRRNTRPTKGGPVS